MRVAIVHHWFVTRGGGERVAECIASMFPSAELFTLISTPGVIPEQLRERTWHNSFLQYIPFATDYHRHLMPLYPSAVESLDLRGFELVISSDSGPVKGVRISKNAVHICYCHSPMRYLYDGYDEYCSHMGAVTRTMFMAFARRLRKWDMDAAQRVTHFIANSNYVAERIRRWYKRDSVVINPPIDVGRGFLSQPQDHYLCAGRLVPYKRTELLIRACKELGRKLAIAGTGPEAATLRRIAGPNAEFLGELSTPRLWKEFACCRALLFAADEDFGMVPLEAQACGRPVIAYGRGGALETVRIDPELRTGVFFDSQTVESVIDGIKRFEALETTFNPQLIRAHAATFDTKIFLSRLRSFILDRVPAASAEMVELQRDCDVPRSVSE